MKRVHIRTQQVREPVDKTGKTGRILLENVNAVSRVCNIHITTSSSAACLDKIRALALDRLSRARCRCVSPLLVCAFPTTLLQLVSQAAAGAIILTRANSLRQHHLLTRHLLTYALVPIQAEKGVAGHMQLHFVFVKFVEP